MPPADPESAAAAGTARVNASAAAAAAESQRFHRFNIRDLLLSKWGKYSASRGGRRKNSGGAEYDLIYYSGEFCKMQERLREWGRRLLENCKQNKKKG